MNGKPKLIFDAGGVLVFPDFTRLALFANQAGIETTAGELRGQHARLFFNFDKYVEQNSHYPSLDYFRDLFNTITQSEEKIQTALRLTLQEDKDNNIWAFTHPWVGNALEILQQQGYQMSVISNSDGRVEQILSDFGLRSYFLDVIDSFVVGVEKPHPQIFNTALDRLQWERSTTLYIGDLYYIDIWGANRAGLGAIHIDQFGHYHDWDGVHIPSIAELPGLLSELVNTPDNFDLFPAKDSNILIDSL